MEIQKKRIAGDFVLSLAASFISTGVLQILLYPFLAKYLSAEEYGIALTIMGVGNTISSAFGGSLNNARLLQNTTYEDRKLQGDFPVLFAIFSIASAIAFGGYLTLTGAMSSLTVILLLGFALFATIRGYASVAFRVMINYSKNLVLNVIVGAAEILGILVLYLSKEHALWPVPFLLGELCGVIYLLLSCNIFREKFCFTPLVSDTCKKTFVLFVTTLIANLILYLDRLLLLPVLGGEAVSTYTVASFFGKSLGVLVTPLAGVLLSYYAQKDFEMTARRYWKINLSMIAFSAVFFLFCAVAGQFGTGVFYPTLIDAARPYILLANLASVINVTSNMVQPAVLKFAPTRWQLIIQVLYGCIYLVVGVFSASRYGLMGFCVSATVAAVIKIGFLLMVGTFALRSVDEER